jgi:hypothetical protein
MVVAPGPSLLGRPVPLSLSDAELAAVQAAAAPVHPLQRDAFLKALAEELERHPVVGPGLVHRCAADLQKTFGVTVHSETLHSAEPRPPSERARRRAEPPELERPPQGRSEPPIGKLRSTERDPRNFMRTRRAQKGGEPCPRCCAANYPEPKRGMHSELRILTGTDGPFERRRHLPLGRLGLAISPPRPTRQGKLNGRGRRDPSRSRADALGTPRPDWVLREYSTIAKLVGAHPTTVGTVRSTVQFRQLPTRLGADGKERRLPSGTWSLSGGRTASQTILFKIS